MTTATDAPSLRDSAVERSIEKARARAQERTTRFVDAALDLVAERNSLEFTLQDVVDRARLSLHAFYQLFESKDALVEAVLEESLERGVAELRQRIDVEAEPLARLRTFVVGYFELAVASRQPMFGAGAAFTIFAVHLDHAAPSKVWDAYRPLRVLAYDLLRAAADEGAIRTDLDADLLATFLLSSVRTVTEVTIAATATLQPSGEQLWQLVAGGVTT
jgi:AcrR family transcriptional regulator